MTTILKDIFSNFLEIYEFYCTYNDPHDYTKFFDILTHDMTIPLGYIHEKDTLIFKTTTKVTFTFIKHTFEYQDPKDNFKLNKLRTSNTIILKNITNLTLNTYLIIRELFNYELFSISTKGQHWVSTHPNQIITDNDLLFLNDIDSEDYIDFINFAIYYFLHDLQIQDTTT
jgi:hypothetical protein